MTNKMRWPAHKDFFYVKLSRREESVSGDLSDFASYDDKHIDWMPAPQDRLRPEFTPHRPQGVGLSDALQTDFVRLSSAAEVEIWVALSCEPFKKTFETYRNILTRVA